MKAFNLPYRETKSFSKTLLAYLDKDPSIKEFIREWPDLEAFSEQMELKSNFQHRNLLVSTLKTQYSRLDATQNSENSENFENSAKQNKVPPIIWQQIDSLTDSQTFTVVTGHQLNVFTGPLYFLFKIATTIKLARQLKLRYPNCHFVPVYWMASEDHDFEEINHTYLYNTKISWEKEVRTATGRVSTDDISDLVKKFQSMLGLEGFTKQLSEIVEEAYLQHNNLADSTRALVNSIFGEEGLLIIDADDKNLKAVFSKIILEDILQQNSYHLVQSTNQKLKEKGLSTQVFAREINFFYLTDLFRERILPLSNGGVEVNQQPISFTSEELVQEINSFPQRFSPNVIMRPLYQELVLPNLAYVGGGAEIVYWMQLKAVFDHYQVPFPLLIPRNSAMFIQDRRLNQWKKMGFELAELFEDSEQLKLRYLNRITSHQLNLASEKLKFEEVFSELKERISQIDVSLEASCGAVAKRLENALNNLEKKMIKADKRNHQSAMDQIQSIKAELFPNGGLQERRENFAQFYLKLGPELVRSLIDCFEPLDFEFTVLAVEK